MVNGKRIIHSNVHFKVFEEAEQAHKFANHFRDVTVNNLENPSRLTNNSWSKRYWGIHRAHDGMKEISGYVTDTEAKMRALTVTNVGLPYPGAHWATFTSFEQARFGGGPKVMESPICNKS